MLRVCTLTIYTFTQHANAMWKKGCPNLVGWYRLVVHYRLRHYSRERLAGQGVSSGNALLIATFHDIFADINGLHLKNSSDRSNA